jgi:hypothetical protein
VLSGRHGAGKKKEAVEKIIYNEGIPIKTPESALFVLVDKA